jgi:YidC/Oxa1 family membrane protein insertase
MRDFLAVPFGWVLSGFYALTDNYVLSILLITILVRLLLLPTSISQQKNSAKQVRLNTKINKIKQKYAGNQQKIQEETQALYQREGFGAANMGCSSLLIQMIVMIGLYGVIYTPITSVLRFSNSTVEKIAKVMEISLKETSRRKGAGMHELSILNKFSDFKEVTKSFAESATLPYTYKNGVYALPDTQSFYVMFYRKDVLQKLKKADIRAEIDDRSEKIGKKIRDTELMKVPYMLVVGEKEVNENKASIRRQGKGDLGAKSVDEFLNDIVTEIKERRAD